MLIEEIPGCQISSSEFFENRAASALQRLSQTPRVAHRLSFLHSNCDTGEGSALLCPAVTTISGKRPPSLEE